MKPRLVIAIAALFYAVLLAAVWVQITHEARANTEAALRRAEQRFKDAIDEDVGSILFFAARLVARNVGSVTAAAQCDMRHLAEFFSLAEINVADRKGRIVASNEPTCLGYDLAADPVTREFMLLFSHTNVLTVSQPFRPGRTKPDELRKFLGVLLPDASGFVQVALDKAVVDRYVAGNPREYIEQYPVGKRGFLTFADADDPRDGRFFTKEVPRLGTCLCRCFQSFTGDFKVVLPYAEYFEGRNRTLLVAAGALLAFFALLTLIVLKLSADAARIARFRAEEDRRRTEDMTLARRIQSSSLVPVSAYATYRAFSAVAVAETAREVGGDFYDLFPSPDGRRFYLVIADVSGKGVPAALFMMETRAVVRAALYANGISPETLAEVNRRLCENNLAEMFVTAWIGELSLDTGALAFVNAGHNRPYVRRASGRVEMLGGENALFFGLFPEATYGVRENLLAPGDTLFLFTDGVTEAMDLRQRPYGRDRLERLLASASGDLCAAVLRDVALHVGAAERSDDITMLAVTFNGAAPAGV